MDKNMDGCLPLFDHLAIAGIHLEHLLRQAETQQVGALTKLKAFIEKRPMAAHLLRIGALQKQRDFVAALAEPQSAELGQKLVDLHVEITQSDISLLEQLLFDRAVAAWVEEEFWKIHCRKGARGTVTQQDLQDSLEKAKQAHHRASHLMQRVGKQASAAAKRKAAKVSRMS